MSSGAVRRFSLSITALVAACEVASAATQNTPLPSVPDTAACLTLLRPNAQANGVSLADFDTWT